MKTISPLRSFALIVTLTCLFGLVACDEPDPTSPASQARLQLAAAPAQIPADGVSTSVITAYVLDPEGAPASGVPIFWTTTDGSLDTAGGTISEGVAQTTLTSSLYATTAIVTAEVTLPVRIENSIEVRFTEASSSRLEITADPNRIPADGNARSVIRVFATLSDGKPAPDGTPIYFSTTAGSLSNDEALTTGGEAVVYLTSSTTEQYAQVTARSGEAVAGTEVFFYSVDVGWIEVRASDYTPYIGTQAVISAILYAMDGTRMGAGITVEFTADDPRVTLDPKSASTVDGIATTRASSQYITPNVTISATAGGVTGSVTIRFTDKRGD